MAEVLWGFAGILIVAFVVYFFAHSWLVRPVLERLWPGFPFIDEVLGPPKEDFWARLERDRQLQERRTGKRGDR